MRTRARASRTTPPRPRAPPAQAQLASRPRPDRAPSDAVIAHLTGTLLEKHVQRLIVDVGGVDYDLDVPLSTFYTVGDPGRAWRSGCIRTCARTRCSCSASPALELSLFQKLIGVSGIGPRSALSVLSGIEPADLVRAIRQSRRRAAGADSGVGEKTGERLLLKLKDRLPQSAAAEPEAPAAEGDDVRADRCRAGEPRLPARGDREDRRKGGAAVDDVRVRAVAYGRY